MKINTEPRHLAIIQKILNQYDYSFYVFGSRATEKVKPLSDLDLCYKEDIPEQDIIKLEEEFEESDLPYKVDLVNYNTCNAEFKKIIDRNCIHLQLPRERLGS